MRDYYRILGIRPDATQAEIKDAWNFSVKAFHPDKFAGSSQRQQAIAHERTKVINEAYGVLSDPIKRANYDRDYKQETHTKSAAASHSPPPPAQDAATARPNAPPPDQTTAGSDSATGKDAATFENRTLLLFLWLGAAAMLIAAAVARNPYSFYVLLRWICCPVFAYSAFAAHEKNRHVWSWIFAALALLYNPIFRVHIDRTTWTGVNWLTIGAIIVATLAFWHKKSPMRPTGTAPDRSPNRSKAPSNRPNIADILGITSGVALILVVIAFASSRRSAEKPQTATLQSAQTEPEIRKAIPAQPNEPEIRKAIPAKDFDPDAYLSQKQEEVKSFDPDAYLKAKQEAAENVQTARVPDRKYLSTDPNAGLEDAKAAAEQRRALQQWEGEEVQCREPFPYPPHKWTHVTQFGKTFAIIKFRERKAGDRKKELEGYTKAIGAKFYKEWSRVRQGGADWVEVVFYK